MCGEEESVSVVPWLIYEEDEGEEVGRVKDVAACEWCVLNAGFCEAMGHHADNDDVSGFYRLDDETRPTWSCCEIHVTKCLEQLVEEVVDDGLRSLDAVLALIDDYSTGHGQLWGEYGEEPVSRANAAANNAKRIPIEGYKNWFTNGHRELVCACGAGTMIKRLSLDRHGKAVVRTEDTCRQCGSITITSGDWRKAQNPDRWLRINPQNPREKPDLLMGNPLTFNDPNASEYGRRRFGHHEGFHGALASRFGLIKDKRWFRRLDEAKVATAMTFCVMHVVALEQRRRVRAAAAQAQAPPALAA